MCVISLIIVVIIINIILTSLLLFRCSTPFRLPWAALYNVCVCVCVFQCVCVRVCVGGGMYNTHMHILIEYQHVFKMSRMQIGWRKIWRISEKSPGGPMVTRSPTAIEGLGFRV